MRSGKSLAIKVYEDVARQQHRWNQLEKLTGGGLLPATVYLSGECYASILSIVHFREPGKGEARVFGLELLRVDVPGYYVHVTPSK